MRKRSDPNRESWTEKLERLKAEVEAMPLGPERDAAARRAQQLESAVHMDGFLRPDQQQKTDVKIDSSGK